MYKKVLLTLFAAGIIGLAGLQPSFAQNYQPYGQNYQPVYNQYPVYSEYQAAPQYYQPSYNNGYDDNRYYDERYWNPDRKHKLKKAATYAAVGAGAGYLLGGERNKGTNALVGAGLGAALSLFLNK